MTRQTTAVVRKYAMKRLIATGIVIMTSAVTFPAFAHPPDPVIDAQVTFKREVCGVIVTGTVNPDGSNIRLVPLGFSPVGTATDLNSGLPMRIRHDATGYELVLIPAGEFMMGSSPAEAAAALKQGMSEPGLSFSSGASFNDEVPRHHVHLDAYYLGVTEVTNCQFLKFRSQHNRDMWGEDVELVVSAPEENASWEDAKAFCDWSGMRLPTEAEWEYACRAGSATIYFWGNEPSAAFANGSGSWPSDGYDRQSPIASFKPNAIGLYDMSGNVIEWCADWYDTTYYSYSPVNNPKGPDSGFYRVLRGGSAYDPPCFLRSACRFYDSPGSQLEIGSGFRAAMSPLQVKR